MQMPQLLKLFRRTRHASGCAAVVLGTRGIHTVQIDHATGKPRVSQCRFHPASEITASVLETAFRESKLDGTKITTLLSSDEYQMLMVDAPNVPTEELKTAVRWKIKDALNCHVDDATIDVLQIPSNKYGGDRPQSLYAIAASNETVRKRIALFEKANIDLRVIDIPEMAQRNIAGLFEQEGRGLAFLSFSDEGGLLTISSDGELFLARHIEITLGQLQDANESLRQQFIDRVELETQRSLDYFDRQFQHIPVTRMMLSMPEGEKMAQNLAENLGLPVEFVDLTQVLDCTAVPELVDGEFASHALLAIGAALRQEKKAL